MKQVNAKAIGQIVLVVGGIVFVYFMASSVVPRTLVTLTKAAPATKVSIKDSLIIGSKILAVADGKDKAIVNVFVLDANGKGVKGKQVGLEGAKNIKAKGTMTDEDGKISFEITSDEEKQYELKATVEGIELSKTITVTFRE